MTISLRKPLLFPIFLVGFVAHVHALNVHFEESSFLKDTIKNGHREFDDLENFERKKYVLEYKENCMIALTHYPSLRRTKIKFTRRRISTTMMCRPRILSVFRRPGHRSYIIVFNKKKNFEGPLYDHIPSNAQIGVVGHELAHIIDFENLSTNQIMGRGIGMLSDHKRSLYEKYIDQLTIEHGLGKELLAWSEYVLFQSNATEEYKQFKKAHYLSPHEIKHHLEKQETHKNE